MLSDQIQRSSRAVADNIAEGNSSYYFGETQSHIREMEDKQHIDLHSSQKMIDEYEQIMRGLNGLINKICELREFFKSKGKKTF